MKHTKEKKMYIYKPIKNKWSAERNYIIYKFTNGNTSQCISFTFSDTVPNLLPFDFHASFMAVLSPSNIYIVIWLTQ